MTLLETWVDATGAPIKGPHEVAAEISHDCEHGDPYEPPCTFCIEGAVRLIYQRLGAHLTHGNT